MALSEQDERAFAELVSQLRPEPSQRAPRRRRHGESALAPILACALGGVLLLVAAHQEWLLGRLSFVSGFSAPSIALALAAGAAALVVAGALVGGASRRPPSDADGHRVENIGSSI